MAPLILLCLTLASGQGQTFESERPITMESGATRDLFAGTQGAAGRQRQWTVYLLPHSHVDIGYTDLQSEAEKIHMDNIGYAIELARKTQDYPEGARYRWNVEVLWAVDGYLRRASPEKRAEFIDAVKKGWIGLDAGYGNVNTSACSPEELLRLFSFAERLRSECGVPLDSMMQVDVPGASWGVVPAAAQAGVKYLVLAPNKSDRIGRIREAWEDKPFYWISPDGEEKILVWQCYPYSIGWELKGRSLPNFRTTDEPKPVKSEDPRVHFLQEFLSERLGHLQETGYPYDVVLLTWAMSDNAPIDPDLPDAVRLWNERYDNPKLVICTTREAAQELERRYADKIPQGRGDYTEYWTDGIGSGAKETATKRASAERAVQAETLWAMLKPEGFPSPDFQEAWRYVLLFCEHTWGAHNSISEPDSDFVKEQWRTKESYVLEADARTRRLLREALETREAGDAPAGAIDVFNTSSWQRTDLVVVPSSMSSAGDRVTDADGNPVPSQRLSSGELAFVASDVPAFGARRYGIEPGSATPPASAASAEGSTLRSSQVALAIDESTGAICSIRSISLDKELVDDVSPTGVNDYFYLPGDKLADLARNGPVRITIKESGPLVASLLVESDAPGCKSLAREVRLIEGLDRVELTDTIDKQAIREKEGIHFGFGFNVPGGKIRLDIPWGVVVPDADQIAGANHNWFAVNRWVEISNPDYGVTWATQDAPLIEIGGITANLLGSQTDSPEWIEKLGPSQTIYSWALNNHWHTNFRADQEGKIVFRYAITPHAAYDPVAAAHFGSERSQPLIVAPAAGAAPPEPPLRINNDGVIATALKPSDDGKALILRLFGVSGKDEKVEIEWSSPTPESVWLSDLSEKRGAQVTGPIDVPAWGVVTLRAETQ
jgi:alpha-mannosidase